MIKRKKFTKRNHKSKKSAQSYSFEFCLKVVKLYLEEGYSPILLNEELGVGKSTVGTWAKKYQEFGEDGLGSKFKTSRGVRTCPRVKKTIVEISMSIKKKI